MDVICLIHSLFQVNIVVFLISMMYELAITVHFLMIICISVICLSSFLLVRRFIAIGLIFMILLRFVIFISRSLNFWLFCRFLRMRSKLT